MVSWMVPSLMWISEIDNAGRSAPGLSALASDLSNGAQFEPPSESNRTAIRGRSRDMSATSIRPVNNGKSRKCATRLVAVSIDAWCASSSATSRSVTVSGGNSDMLTLPWIVGSSPVAAWICAFTASRAVSVEIRNEETPIAPRPMTTRAAKANPMRLNPMTVVTSTDPECRRAGTPEAENRDAPRRRRRNPVTAVCVAFVAGFLPAIILNDRQVSGFGRCRFYINTNRAAS